MHADVGQGVMEPWEDRAHNRSDRVGERSWGGEEDDVSKGVELGGSSSALEVFEDREHDHTTPPKGLRDRVEREGQRARPAIERPDRVHGDRSGRGGHATNLVEEPRVCEERRGLERVEEIDEDDPWQFQNVLAT